jgi:hypothetical protein
MTQGKVTSLGMTEIKWVIADLNQTGSVKEQRVDGSSVSTDAVRCTLVAGKPVLERNKVNGLIRLCSNSRLKIPQ